MNEETRYEAFISYKHDTIDDQVAKDIQNRIERYKIPKDLQKKTGIQKFNRIFRDTTELSGTSDLPPEIEKALKNSTFLIVICSERTRRSKWVPLEIELFLKYHDRSHILTVLVDGKEPADVIPDVLLKENISRTCPDGSIKFEEKKLIPLSCDFRTNTRRAKAQEIPRLISRMLGCSYDELYRRELRYRQARFFTISAIFLCLLFIASLYLAWSNHEISRNYKDSIRQKAIYAASLENEYLQKGQRIAAINVGISSTDSLSDDELSMAPELLKGLEDASRVYSCGFDGHFDNTVNTQEFSADGSVRQITCDPAGKYICCCDWNNNLYIWSTESQNMIYQKQWNYIDNTIITSSGMALVSMNKSISCIDCSTGTLVWEQEYTSPIIHIFEKSKTKAGIISNDSLKIIDIHTSNILEKEYLQDFLPQELGDNTEYSSITFSLFSGTTLYNTNTKSNNNKWLLLDITADKDILAFDTYIGLFDVQNKKIYLIDNQYLETQDDYAFPFTFITDQGDIYFANISESLPKTSYLSRISPTEGIVWSKDLGYVISLERSMLNGNASMSLPNGRFGFYDDIENNLSVLIAVIGSNVLFFNADTGDIMYSATMPSEPSLYVDEKLGEILLLMPGMIGYIDNNDGISSGQFPLTEFENYIFIQSNDCYTKKDMYIFSTDSHVYVFQEISDNPDIVKYVTNDNTNNSAAEYLMINNELIEINATHESFIVQKYKGNNQNPIWSSSISGHYQNVIGNNYHGGYLYINITSDYTDIKVAIVNLETGDSTVFNVVGNHTDSGEYINNSDLLGGIGDSFIFCSSWFDYNNQITNIYEYNVKNKILTEHIIPFELSTTCPGIVMSENQLLCFSNQNEVYIIETDNWQVSLLAENFAESELSDALYTLNPTRNTYALYRSGGTGLFVFTDNPSNNYVISRSSKIIASSFCNDLFYVLFSDGVLGRYYISNGVLKDTINIDESFSDLGEKNTRLINHDNELVVSSSRGVFFVDLVYKTVRSKVSTAIGYDTVNDGFYLHIYDNTKNVYNAGWVQHYSANEVIEKAKQMVQAYSID